MPCDFRIHPRNSTKKLNNLEGFREDLDEYQDWDYLLKAVEKSDSNLLLNNDIEVITSSWLEEMVSHALRPETGVVGAKLIYPTEKIQHAGVILGLGGIAGHAFRHYDRDATGPRERLRVVQNYSAVTGACMLFKR